jgi:GT2 family glycosyltransferase
VSAKVTLVVTQRQRMAHTQRSLENILSDQSEPFRLIYVDGGSPEPVRDYLARRVPEIGGILIRRPEWLWPSVARNLALAHVETPYVVFIDNDVMVEPGWLGKLLRAADETGAALVGPLYLTSDGNGQAHIHMAGGTITRVKTPAGEALHERHEAINAPVAERDRMVRGACDFVEYHCVLARTAFVRNVGGLSEDIVCVHEHIDIALEAKSANLSVVFEPAAAITEYAFAPFHVADLPFHRWRWRRSAAQESLTAFCRKWNVVDDGESTDVQAFVDALTSSIDPLVPWLENARPERPLAARDVQQSLYGLLVQAHAQGYAKADLELFTKAHNAAMSLFVGGYRSCGRSFLMHCVGTASVLVAFTFAPRLVVAGLLHAAYSHAPLGPQPHAALNELSARIRDGFGERIEQLIRRYQRARQTPDAWRAAHPVETMLTQDAEIVALDIANEIDAWASGEYVFTGKASPLTPEWATYYEVLSRALGVPAFAKTLSDLAQTKRPQGFPLSQKPTGSYRLARGGVAPMANNAFQSWDDAAPTKRTA